MTKNRVEQLYLIGRRNPGDGDPSNDILHELSARIVRYVTRFGNSPDVAKDVRQEVLVKLLTTTALDNVSSREHVVNLSLLMARQCLIASFRDSKAELKLKRSTIGGDEEDPSAEEDLRRALSKLTREQQQLLQWKLEGKSLPEIARALETTYSNAAQKVHRLKQEIKDLLEDAPPHRPIRARGKSNKNNNRRGKKE